MCAKKGQIYCFLRKIWVIATPEEIVRQKTLRLLDELKFPISSIAVEKELKMLPHLQHRLSDLPDRRIDILCFTAASHEMHPLLLIECKATPLSSKEIAQLIGYNHLIKASFITLINQYEQKTGWFDYKKLEYQFVNYIPLYHQLMDSFLY